MRKAGYSVILTLLGILMFTIASPGARAADYRLETPYVPRLLVTPASISVDAELGATIPNQSLNVSVDQGSGISYSINDNQVWMDVAPASGSAFSGINSVHAVSFDKSFLTAETTYNAIISVSAGGTSNSPVRVPVQVHVLKSINITAPLVGAQWTQGRAYEIRWNVMSSTSGPTHFEIYKGGSLIYTESTSHAGAGSFFPTFKVPYSFAPGNDYSVRVVGANGRFDSKGPFTVKVPPIKVELPNGGETWEMYRPAQIIWKINDLTKIGTWLDFYLYRFDTTAGSFPYVKVANLGADGNAAGAGAFNLTVPDVGSPGTQYVVIAVKHNTSMAYPGSLDPDLIDASDNVFTIANPPIRVLSPNLGTETWTVLDPVTVHWRANTPAARVGLELWNDSAKVADLITTPDSSATGENTKTVTVPLVPAGEYRVRAFRADNLAAKWEDFSDNSFTIVVPDVKVVSPNGGETTFINTELTIQWLINIRNTGAHATVELWKGNTWIMELRHVVCTDGLNRLTLMVPNVATGTDYRIRVAGVYDPDYNDFSNGYFRIDPKPIKVITPNGLDSEIFYLGGQVPIRWTNVVSQTGTEFYVDVYMQDYMMFRLPDVYVSNGDKTISLTLPDWLWSGDYYRVRVISKAHPALYDESDGLFAITAAPIRLYSPMPGQTFLTGQTITAEYNLNMVLTGGTQVKFELVRVSDGTHSVLPGPNGQVVFYPTFSGGQLDLKIPEYVAPGFYYVRIISNNKPQYYDDTDGPVLIKPPAIQLIAPNAGGPYSAGGTMDIHWKTYLPDSGATVRIQLWRKSGGLAADLGTDTKSTGENTKTVTLPTTLQYRTDYFIRVLSESNYYLFDDSDGVFTIKAVPPPPGSLTASAGASAITLNWDPAPDDTVSGYNVYRSTSATGTFTKINPSLVMQPYYTDASVTRGVRYYYQVRSVSYYSQVSATPSNTANAIVGQVKLLMQDLRGGVGTEIMVHVYCPNVTGVLANRLNLVIKYPSIVTPVRLEKTVMTNPFRYTHNAVATNTTGMVTITGSATPNVALSGAGRMFDVVFKVNTTARAYQLATFSFGSTTKLYVMSGAVLTPDLTDTAILTVDNRYKMGDIDGNGVVNSSDVSFGLSRLSAGVTTLQLVAGDIDGDGAFSLVDVQLIMLLVQGKSINPVQLNKVAMKPALAGLEAAKTYNVTLTAKDGEINEIISLPVALSPASGIAVIQMQVNFDPGVLKLLSVSTTSLTNGFLISQPYMIEPPNAGVMGFGVVNTTAIGAGSGQVILLNFKVIGAPGSSSQVRIASCEMSDALGSSVTNGDNTINLAGAQGTVHVTTVVPQNAARSEWAMYP